MVSVTTKVLPHTGSLGIHFSLIVSHDICVIVIPYLDFLPVHNRPKFTEIQGPLTQKHMFVVSKVIHHQSFPYENHRKCYKKLA